MYNCTYIYAHIEASVYVMHTLTYTFQTTSHHTDTSNMNSIHIKYAQVHTWNWQ